MRKLIPFFVLSLLFILPNSARCEERLPRGLFVSVVQERQVLLNRTEIVKLISFAKKARIQKLFIQVYRSNKAWFPSRYADDSPYKLGFKNLSEDPFAFLIARAHQEGIEVHAWLNLLSLGNNKDAQMLKKYGVDILTKNLKPKIKLADYKIDEQYFLEPGDPRVRGELVKIVGEVLSSYPDLDGIQFDYIRYPDKDPHYGYTKSNIEQFKQTTGRQTIEENSQVWKDWKRQQVTDLLALLVNKSRSLRPKLQVSATGCMPYSRAYHEAFQDWPSWSGRGLVDFVTVMNYSPDPKEFERWNRTIKTKVKDFNKVYIGVGAYKLVRSPKVFEEEFRGCEEMGNACAVFHYGSILESPELGQFLIRGGRSLSGKP